MRWFILTGALIVSAADVSAQPLFGPGGAYFNGGGISLNYKSKRLNVSAAFGRSSFYQYGLIGPPVFGNWYGYASPWIAPPPPPFFFGANPFFLPPPPPLVVAPQIIVQQPIIIQQPIVQAKAEEPEPIKVPNLDRFIVIHPGMPANNQMPKQNPMAVAQKQPKDVEFGVKPAPLPLAAPRAGNPLAEADRQLEDGRAAFARGEYGRALDHFRRATLTAPAESAGYFLLSQAQFAIGKYDDAVTSIAMGLELRSDWAMSRFHPRGLYGRKPEAFDFHLRNLRTALDASLDDSRLLFLLGVELWFDGKRDDAKTMLERAARLTRDPAPILTFLGK